MKKFNNFINESVEFRVGDIVKYIYLDDYKKGQRRFNKLAKVVYVTNFRLAVEFFEPVGIPNSYAEHFGAKEGYGSYLFKDKFKLVNDSEETNFEEWVEESMGDGLKVDDLVEVTGTQDEISFNKELGRIIEIEYDKEYGKCITVQFRRSIIEINGIVWCNTWDDEGNCWMICEFDINGKPTNIIIEKIEDKPEEQNYEEWVDETKKKWV